MSPNCAPLRRQGEPMPNRAGPRGRLLSHPTLAAKWDLRISLYLRDGLHIRDQIPRQAGWGILEELNGPNLAKYLNSVALRQPRSDCKRSKP